MDLSTENTLSTVPKRRNNEKTSRKRKDNRQPFSVIQVVADSPKLMVGRDNKNKRQKTSKCKPRIDTDDERENVCDGETDKNLSSCKKIQSELELDKKCDSESGGNEDEVATQLKIEEIEKENLMLYEEVKIKKVEISELQKQVDPVNLFDELFEEMIDRKTNRENFCKRAELVEKLMKELYSHVKEDSEKINDRADCIVQLVNYFNIHFDCMNSTDNKNFFVLLSSKNLDSVIEKKFEICWNDFIRDSIQHVDIKNGSKTAIENKNDNLEKNKNVLHDENNLEKKKLSPKELAEKGKLKLDEIFIENEILWDKVIALNAERDDLKKTANRAKFLEETINEYFEEEEHLQDVNDACELLKKLVKELLIDRNEVADENNQVVVDDDDFEKELRSYAAFVESSVDDE